jgi:hypothetical protein
MGIPEVDRQEGIKMGELPSIIAQIVILPTRDAHFAGRISSYRVIDLRAVIHDERTLCNDRLIKLGSGKDEHMSLRCGYERNPLRR